MLFQIKINTECAYECTYCSVYDNTIVQKTFDYKNFKNVIKQYDDIIVFIYGGEPFQSEDLVDLILFLEEFDNIRCIDIQSNGTNIKKLPSNLRKTNVRLSYHPSKTTLTKILNVTKNQYVNSISVMTNNVKHFKEYNILKNLYPEMDILYCPIVNSKEYGVVDDYLEDVVNDAYGVEYHFDIRFILENGCYKKGNFKCSIREEVLEIYNNQIFICDMNFNNGITFKNFKRNVHELTDICPSSMCNFNNAKYIKEDS